MTPAQLAAQQDPDILLADLPALCSASACPVFWEYYGLGSTADLLSFVRFVLDCFSSPLK